MDILQAIELRLYRFAQEGYQSKDHVKAAQDMAVEIMNLTIESLTETQPKEKQ